MSAHWSKTTMSIHNDEREVRVAAFFVNWYNAEYSRDYGVPSKKPEDAGGVDFTVLSSSGKYPDVKLQLTSAEGAGFEKTMADAFIERGGEFDIDLSHAPPILRAFHKKVHHAATDVYLIIHREFGALWDPSAARKAFNGTEGELNRWRRVFYVHTPSASKTHGGQVIPLK